MPKVRQAPSTAGAAKRVDEGRLSTVKRVGR